MPVFDAPIPVWIDIDVVGDDLDFGSVFLAYEVGENSADDGCHSTVTLYVRTVVMYPLEENRPGDDDQWDIVGFAPRVEVFETWVELDVCGRLVQLAPAVR